VLNGFGKAEDISATQAGLTRNVGSGSNSRARTCRTRAPFPG
jgi:hypothetical protein